MHTAMARFVKCLVLLFLLHCVGATEIHVNSSSSNAVDDSSCWTGLQPCLTLDLGLQGAHEATDSNVTLIVAEGQYNLSESVYTTFEDVNSISIIGSPSAHPPTTIVTCTDSVGFSFVHSSNIVIRGIEFSNCSQLRNSTSYTGNAKVHKFIMFYVSFYMLYCTDVSMQNASISNNNGTGLVIYNPAGTIVLERSTFSNNRQFELAAGGGGVYIEFSYCVPYNEDGLDCLKDGISNVDPLFTSDTSISIRYCTFYHNKANASDYLDSTFILPSGQHHSAFGRGGGLSLFFKGNAEGNDVLVDNCNFIQNSALWGGGIFAEFQDSATTNIIQVIDSLLHENDASFMSSKEIGTEGGGARLGYAFYDKQSVDGNSIVFINCTMVNNTASVGGGMSFYSSRQLYHSHSANSLSLIDCNFQHNNASLGSALSTSLWHISLSGRPPAVSITNCNFTSNYPISSLFEILGHGAVYVDGLPIILEGVVKFTHNRGSALVITGSHVTVAKNASVSFVSNQGRNGGAMELLSTSFIVTGDNSRLEFIANSADYNGGAIYHFDTGGSNMIGSQNCFIRFQDVGTLPQEWTSIFYFAGNLADSKDNAIYTPTLLPCLWGGGYNSSEDISTATRDVFCWNENWTYAKNKTGKTNSNCSAQIATAPSRYTFPKSFYSAYPGEVVHLDISAYDDLNHTVSEQTVFLARILNNTSSFGGFNYRYVSHGFFDINGVNSTVQIQFETIEPVVLQSEITVTLNECPPGFMLDQDSHLCYCTGNFNSYLRCDNTTFTSSINRGVWLGPVETDNGTEILAGLCPYVYEASSQVLVDLPTNQNLSEFLCGSTNREGVLCGKCKSGYGIAINGDYSCIECPNESLYYSWVYYLLTEFFLLTIFCLIIFVCGVTVTWGPLNSYILFAQIVTSAVSVSADGTIPLSVLGSKLKVSYSTLKALYTVPYEVWNMNFFQEQMPQFCISQRLNAIDILALGYITALYPLLLLVICVGMVQAYSKRVKVVVRFFKPFHRCLIRLRQVANWRQSITGGIAAFIVISYTKFCSVSFYILTPIPLLRANGSVGKVVYYQDGTIAFYSTYSILYFTLACSMLATFVAIPPLLLVYPSLLRLIERVSKKQLGKFYPPSKLQIFLDEFHGCFKDGTTDNGIDCRWFAGLFFIIRISLFAIYSYTSNWGIQFVVQLVVFLLMTFLFVLFKPYRKEWINTLDISMFLLLSAITGLSQYNLQLTWLGLVEEKLLWGFVIQYILLFLPLVYFIIYHGVYLVARWKEVCAKLVLETLRRRREHDLAQKCEDNDEQIDLMDSTHVPDFLEYVQDTGRINQAIHTSSAPTMSGSCSQVKKSSFRVMYDVITESPAEMMNGSVNGESNRPLYGSTDED